MVGRPASPTWWVLALAAMLGLGCAAQPEVEPTSSSQVTPTPSSVPTGTEPDVTSGSVVVGVVDGDTFDVALPAGGEERVRILGINAPERGECLATDATEALSQLVAAEEVDLVADRSDRDRYGRLLRYVEVDGDDAGVALVRDGYAVVRVSEPDTARAATLRAAEADARALGVGLWNPSACGPAIAGSEGMRLVGLRLDAEGDDSQNLNDEWVDIRNEGRGPVDLTGWRVRDESASNRFDFPDGFTLAAGAEVRVRSGCGAPTATELFWCTSGAAIWNNDGDTAFLLDPAGNVVHSLAG